MKLKKKIINLPDRDTVQLILLRINFFKYLMTMMALVSKLLLSSCPVDNQQRDVLPMALLSIWNIYIAFYGNSQFYPLK